MKTLLPILCLFTLLSCSNNDDSGGCYCENAKYNNAGQFLYFPNVATDCATGQPLQRPPGYFDAYFVGCED